MSNIAAKFAHVRAAGQNRDHHCHWPGCDKQVPPAKWGCLKHWKMLPGNIQRAIWRSYRIGQEADGRPSTFYLAAARAARDWILANHPPGPEQLGLILDQEPNP